MKVIPLILITFSIILITPKTLSQVVRSSDFNPLATTSSNDLMGVEPRTIKDWNWGVGGEFPEAQESTPLDSNSLNLDLYDAKVEKLNQTYDVLDYQLGDYQRPTSRFVVTDF